MKTCIVLAAATLLAAPLAAQPAADQGALDRALAGRTAGAPVACIPLSRVRSSTVIDGTAILYRIGNTIYVNRPRSGAERLDQDGTLVTRSSSTNLCRGEPVRMRDRFTGTFLGAIILGDFVPYRRG